MLQHSLRTRWHHYNPIKSLEMKKNKIHRKKGVFFINRLHTTRLPNVETVCQPVFSQFSVDTGLWYNRSHRCFLTTRRPSSIQTVSTLALTMASLTIDISPIIFHNFFRWIKLFYMVPPLKYMYTVQHLKRVSVTWKFGARFNTKYNALYNYHQKKES